MKTIIQVKVEFIRTIESTCDTCMPIVPVEIIVHTMVMVLMYTMQMIVGDNIGKRDKRGA